MVRTDINAVLANSGNGIANLDRLVASSLTLPYCALGRCQSGI